VSTPTIAPGPQGPAQAPAPHQASKQAAALPAWPYPVGVFATEVANDYDQTVTATTTTVAMPDVKLDPDGWTRDVWFDFTLTGVNTTSTTVTALEDWPFNAINTVLFKDTGTQQSFGPFNGWDWRSVNKYGAYETLGDPRADVDYSITTGTGTTAGSARFFLQLPAEISHHDALGSIQNQSDNSIYKVSLTIETTANQFVTAPATSQTVRCRVTQDSYTEPVAALALGGRPVMSAPPSPGTRQFWVNDDDTGIAAASHTTKITNGIGYAYRTIVLKFQYGGTVGTAGSTSTGGRGQGDASATSTQWPDPLEFWLAGTRIKKLYNNTWRSKMSRRYGYTSQTLESANGPDYSVRVLNWNQDVGLEPGNEARRTYLRSQDGNVFKFIGTWGHAGTVWMLTNYVIPKGGPSAYAQIVA